MTQPTNPLLRAMFAANAVQDASLAPTPRQQAAFEAQLSALTAPGDQATDFVSRRSKAATPPPTAPTHGAERS